MDGALTPSDMIALIGAIYFGAGVIKGVIGLGLPTTAITFLSVFFAPLLVLAINLIPMFMANIWQFARAQKKRAIIKRYHPFALSLLLSIFLFSFITVRIPVAGLSFIIAATIIGFALYNLVGNSITIAPSHDTKWQVLCGVAAGLLGALTSMWAVPLLVYLTSLRLPKDEFVNVSGYLLLVGCLPLAIGYVVTGIITSAIVPYGLFAAAMAIIGFMVGEYLRRYVNQHVFRRLVLWFFLVMGLRMAAYAVPI